MQRYLYKMLKKTKKGISSRSPFPVFVWIMVAAIFKFVFCAMSSGQIITWLHATTLVFLSGILFRTHTCTMQPFVLVLKCVTNPLGIPGFPESPFLRWTHFVFHTHVFLIPHFLLSKGEKAFFVCRKGLSNMYCFLYFSHAPHGKHIKSPAKFQ